MSTACSTLAIPSAAPTGSPPTRVEADNNYAGAYIGEHAITADITGRSYTGEGAGLRRGGGVCAADADRGDRPELHVDHHDYTKSGALAGVTDDVTDAPGESYFVGHFHHGASGGLRWESAELENGGFQITGEANGVHVGRPWRRRDDGRRIARHLRAGHDVRRRYDHRFCEPRSRRAVTTRFRCPRRTSPISTRSCRRRTTRGATW